MALYLPFKTFTMVVTPHADKQSRARSGVSMVEFMADNGVNIQELFDKLVEDECFAIPINGLLLYTKKKYNSQRRRQELECISLTPSVRVHTLTKTFAKTIDKSRDVSNSTFPQWFNDE